MDLVKAKKVIQKAFKDHNVKSDLDEETLMYFICVDLVREDISDSSSAPARSTNRNRGSNTPGQGGGGENGQ